MPTYEYRCSACEHELEEFQSIMAKPLRKCPACGKNTLKRLIGTGAGVVFKGSGFWQTDYARSGEYKKAAESDSAPAAAPASGGEKKADSGSGAGETKSAGGSESKPAEAKQVEAKAPEPKASKSQSKTGKSGGSKRRSA